MAHRAARPRRRSGPSPVAGRRARAAQSIAAACSIGSRSHTDRVRRRARRSTGARRGRHQVASRPSAVERRRHLEPVVRDRVGRAPPGPRARTRCAPGRRPARRAAGGQRRPVQLPVEHAGVALHGRQGRPRRVRRRPAAVAAASDRWRCAVERRRRPSCPAPTRARRRPAPCPPTAAGGSRGWGLGHGRFLPCGPMARFTTPETLPEGEEKVAAVRSMFDAIAPRYDLVNRIMTFRMDVGWRRRTVRVARPARRAPPSLDLACGTGDLCRELAAPGPPPDRRRPVLRDAGRRPHRRPRSLQGDVLRLPRARRRRSTASPAASPCGTSPPSRRSSPSWPGSCARAGASPCSRWPSRPTGCCASATASTSARSCRCIGGLLSDPAAYRYLPRSVAYLPDARAMLGAARRRRLRRRGPPPARRSASPS